MTNTASLTIVSQIDGRVKALWSKADAPGYMTKCQTFKDFPVEGTFDGKVLSLKGEGDGCKQTLNFKVGVDPEHLLRHDNPNDNGWHVVLDP
jgi:hypothetical protein